MPDPRKLVIPLAFGAALGAKELLEPEEVEAGSKPSFIKKALKLGASKEGVEALEKVPSKFFKGLELHETGNLAEGAGPIKEFGRFSENFKTFGDEVAYFDALDWSNIPEKKVKGGGSLKVHFPKKSVGVLSPSPEIDRDLLETLGKHIYESFPKERGKIVPQLTKRPSKEIFTLHKGELTLAKQRGHLTPEDLTSRTVEGNIKRDSFSKGFAKKYLPLVAGATTTGAGLLGSEAQAEEPTKSMSQKERMGLASRPPPAIEEETQPVPATQAERLSLGPTTPGSQKERMMSYFPMVQEPGTVEKVWDWVKEHGPETALDLGIYAAAVPVAAALGATGVGLPIAAGLGVTAAMAGKELIKGKPAFEPGGSLTELGLGLVGGPGDFGTVGSAVVETAENIMFMGGGGKILKLIKKPAAKGILKGVQKVSLFKPLEPVSEAIWENVFVKPFSKGPLEATAFGAGAGALVGGLTSEDTLEGMLTGAGIGATGMAGAAGIAKMKGLTLREALQPAIERLRVDQPNVERSFQKAKVQQALTREAFADAIKESKTLLPTEQIEFQKGLTRSIPFGDIKSPKAKDLVYRTERRIVQVTESPYRATLMDELGKSMMKPFEEIESKYTPTSIMRLTRLVEKPLVGKGSPTKKEIRDVLTRGIHNPRFKPEIQQFYKDLYNFSAQAPLDVAEALTHSSNEYLISKLVKNPGVVSSSLKPGYVESTHPSIKGMFVAKDIELELEAMRKIPQIANAWSNKWFMGPWKTNKVILRPATHFRNIFGNVFANDAFGGMNAFDPRNWKIYVDAALDLKNTGPNTRDFKKLTGMTGRWGKEEMDQLVPALRYGANIFDKSLNLFDTIAAPARGIYAAEESWAKVAKFMFNRKQGMKDIEAAYDAMKCTLNYSEITPFTAQVRAYAIPFYTWQSKTIPMTVEAAVKHPLRLGKWIALGAYLQNYALDQVGLSDGEWETIQKTMPEYMQKGMYLLMPWRDEKKQLKMLNLTWLVPGIGDISEAYQKGVQNPATLALQQPLIGLASTFLTKKKFSGAPLYYDWEHPATKFAKQAGAVWEMWSPAPMPGNVDWKTLWDAIQERPEALSTEEAVASQFGFRLQSVDPTQMKRRSEALKRIHETEISTEMKRELRRTKNPEEISDVLDKYRRLRLEQREP